MCVCVCVFEREVYVSLCISKYNPLFSERKFNQASGNAYICACQLTSLSQKSHNSEDTPHLGDKVDRRIHQIPAALAGN